MTRWKSLAAALTAGGLAFVQMAMCAPAAAPDPAPLRVVFFDVSKLPRLTAPLDLRRSKADPAEFSAADFRLLENGRKLATGDQITKFRESGLGLALVVALDASQSMNGRPLEAIRQGLGDLLRRKGSKDYLAILSFANDLRWDARWDATDRAKEEAIQRLQVRGRQTRLYDAVSAAVGELETEADRDPHFPQRRCLLVLSDGHDEGSNASIETVLKRISDSRVRVDSVGFGPSPIWFKSLQSMSLAGFGEWRRAESPEQLQQYVGKGIDMLLDMPVVGFKSDELSEDGSTHKLTIEHVPTNIKDQLSVTLPEKAFYQQPLVWGIGGVVGLVILMGAGMAMRSRGGQRTMAPPAPTPVIAAPPVAAAPAKAAAPARVVRAATVAETPADPVRSGASAPYRPSVVEASRPLPAANPELPTRVRVGTALAPPAATAGLVPLTLLATSGPYAGRRFPVTGQEFWVGSAPNNSLCLEADSGVSSNHACLRREGQFCRIYDNSSLNRSWVNGRAISGNETVMLNIGDRLCFGQSEFLVEGA